MRARRVVIFGTLIASVIFGVYLLGLYRQLKIAFNDRTEHDFPTRIYSDVTRLAPPATRQWVEERLRALGYRTDASEEKITFTLHTVDYPGYLLPGSALTALGEPESYDKRPVTLEFSGTGADSPLQSIAFGDTEVSEIFLEPELVATLARPGGEGKRQIREVVGFDDIPSPVVKAIIAIEDHHFLEHSGFDPRGLARAVLVNLRTLSFAQGGSTITQQLVKNLMARRTKNLFRKVNELFLALLLEATFDKNQILERYLNEVYLGQVGSFEVHGVSEGARYFFGRKLEELNLAEIAMMAGFIRGPGFYSPYRHFERALERARLVLRRMVETGMIAEEEAREAEKMPVRLAAPQNVSNKAPYFTDYVKAELIRKLKGRRAEEEIADSGFRVYTTLDVSMNQAAQQAVAEGIQELERKVGLSGATPSDRLEGALASVDPATGFIRALIGGRSYAQSNFNRILNMKRQVGSTFKPIVYLAALQKGTDPNGIPYGPGHPAEDAPWTLTYDRGKQNWSPRNYEKGFRGWVTHRTALAHSINTVTARIGWEVGIDRIIETARTLGIESELPAVPSLALGVAELSPIELLRAYAVFANHGVQDELTVIRAITESDGAEFARFVFHPRQVIEPGIADLLTEMLTSVFTEGTAHHAYKLGFDRPAAGKTGTTSNHRDSWFAGYSPQLATVVWVGMDQPGAPPLPAAKKKGIALTGASSALPIWIAFMKKALAGEPPVPFPLSPNLVDVSIDRHTGLQASPECPSAQLITEKYPRGLEPRGLSCEPMWPASLRSTSE
ncbi:MAG: PBP1A family penicillin-binding protein [Oligoflexia bacterium]|nr:PBP1A family penicillin-binding protein [Oligoflexia bacterium]